MDSQKTVIGPDGNEYHFCAICNDSVFHRNPALDSDAFEDADKLQLPENVLDDVVFNMCTKQHHFHWECVTTNKGDVDYCPACVASVSGSDSGAVVGGGVAANGTDPLFGYVANDIGQVLASVTTDEGGTEYDYNLKDAILYEQTLDRGLLLDQVRDKIEELRPFLESQEENGENDGQEAKQQKLELVMQDLPLSVLSQALFEACWVGDMSGVLEILTLLSSTQDIYTLVNQPLIGGASSSATGIGGSSALNSNSSNEAPGVTDNLMSLRRGFLGWTPLFEAVANGRGYLVNTLLTSGANPHAKSVDSETGMSKNAAEFARARGRPDIAVFIEAHMD